MSAHGCLRGQYNTKKELDALKENLGDKGKGARTEKLSYLFLSPSTL